MHRVIEVMNVPNTDKFANWSFFFAMCGFEPVGITGVTKDNKLIRTRFTNREMDFMIFVVLKAKHTDDWSSLHRLLMPYFEWAVLKMVLYSIKIQSTEIREK